MTPEATDYLAKSGQFIAKARDMLADGWPDEAARAAYLAAYHAATAFVFERSGRAAKSHSGLRTLFAEEARREVRLTVGTRSSWRADWARACTAGRASKLASRRSRSRRPSANRAQLAVVGASVARSRAARCSSMGGSGSGGT